MFTLFERSLASPAGDTQEEPPVRTVPYLPQSRRNERQYQTDSFLGDRDAVNVDIVRVVRVKEHRRKDGTVVKGHLRSPRRRLPSQLSE
jgi:hypothetical protein